MIIKKENNVIKITENDKILFNEKIEDIFKKNTDKDKDFINITECEIYVSEKLNEFEEYKKLTKDEKEKISQEIFEMLS